MTDIEKISRERRLVIENIANAAAEGDTFKKTELGDPQLSDDDIKKVILGFDNMRKSAAAKVKAHIARRLAESLTKKVNQRTSIVGVENALSVSGSAIITSNHYAPTDSTPIRMLAEICDKRKKLHIIVQESNVFMTGLFGFLMKNCNTHPVSKNKEYTVRNLKPCVENILKDDNFLLIYPEQEMWRNYKKPRMLRDGAYYWAAYYGVPIIPTFTEMTTLQGERDSDGFLPIRHTLHVGNPIYPNPNLSVHENRDIMQIKDYNFKKFVYEEAYKIPLSDDFVPERDIAGVAYL